MKDLLENKMFKVFVGIILLIIIIIVVAIIVISGQNKKLNEQDLINGAQLYYQKNQTLLPKENYDSATVQLSTLISSGYISSNKKGSTCPSYVMVTNMNGTYSYTPFIKCTTDNNTVSLMSKLTADMTTSGSGLYNENGKFIYRGENPNNYVKFGESLWRVIGLDENNNIKMVYSDVYVDYREWDNRYNKEINKDRGINNFIGEENSRIKEYLDSYFSNERNFKKYNAARIARTTKFTTCIDKHDIQTGNVNSCNVKYTARISTLTISDYINASLDTSCNINNTINCRNYNFLNQNSWTINAYSSNTYEAYVIDQNKGIYTMETHIREAIRPVIALRNDVSYVSGSGTEIDPYMIG